MVLFARIPADPADLIFLWNDEVTANERDEIISDIQELIDDCNRHEQEEYRYIKLNDLDQVKHNIREFKDGLLKWLTIEGGLAHYQNSPIFLNHHYHVFLIQTPCQDAVP